MHGNCTKDRIQILRLTLTLFLESVIVLDAAIGQVAAEHLNGEPILFTNSVIKLAEQLQMAKMLSDYFNSLARALGVTEINLEELRISLQSKTDYQVSLWTNIARAESLSEFGTGAEMRAALEQLVPHEPNGRT
jgi:hypothetical protein